MNMEASIAQLAVYHDLPFEESSKLKGYAKQAATWLRQLRSASAKADHKKVRSLTQAALRSYAFKVCGIMRAGLDGLKPVTLAAVEERAAQLNPFDPIQEPVTALLRRKHDGNWRVVLDFAWKRRALTNVAACILDAVLPQFDFDYMERGKGRDNAIRFLKLIIDKDGYQYVVTADVRNCYWSANKEEVIHALPLPPQVTNHVLLVGDGVEVIPKLHKTAPAISLGAGDLLATDEVARLGIPQGSAASSIIMRRAVIGPALAQLPFVLDLVLYEDEVAVAVKTKEEAEAVLEALKTTMSSIPAGPLAIGRSSIKHISEGFEFLGYRVMRKPLEHGGHLYVRPSNAAYRRAENEARKRYQQAGGGWVGMLAIGRYWHKKWRPAFRLWKPNPKAIEYQWLQLLAGGLPKP